MKPDISWIDEFAQSIKPHVFVRERDSLLILLPNQAYKLNPSGIHLLKHVLDGTPIYTVMDTWADDERALEDVHEFFCDVRALVMGCLGDGQGRRAVETGTFSRPHNTYPVLSEIAITYRCNLKCRFCYAGCNCTRKPNKQEMTTAQAKQVLDKIRYEAEVPSVSWTGGEPLLRDDLPELTSYAVSIGMRVNLITNGTLVTKDLANRLKDSGLRSAQVSLEAPNAEVHDALTTVNGSFESTLNGIRILQDTGLHVHTNTTLNSENLACAADMPQLAKDLGIDRLSMNMAIPCGSANSGGVTIKYTDVISTVEDVRKVSRQIGVQFMWYSPTPYCIYNPIAAGLGGKSCAACDGLLSVTPNGDVIPCSSLDQPVGNLLRSSFEKVWSSKKAVYWREKRYAKPMCTNCESFDLCSGACPIYLDAMGHGEIEEARRPAAV